MKKTIQVFTVVVLLSLVLVVKKNNAIQVPRTSSSRIAWEYAQYTLTTQSSLFMWQTSNSKDSVFIQRTSLKP